MLLGNLIEIEFPEDFQGFSLPQRTPFKLKAEVFKGNEACRYE